jgi:hypothetical protein
MVCSPHNLAFATTIIIGSQSKMTMKFQTPPALYSSPRTTNTLTMFPTYDLRDLLTAPLPPSIMTLAPTPTTTNTNTVTIVDPDPLYPEGWGVQEVDKMPSFEDTASAFKDQQGKASVDLLSQLSHQNNKPDPMGDSVEPVDTVSCVQDHQRQKERSPINQILFGSSSPPTTAKKTKSTLTRSEFTFKNEQWMQRYEDLFFFNQEHGHCLVNKNMNPILAQWVKRQRYQFKLRSEGKHSTLTDERLLALESLDFIWESNRVTWEGRFKELSAYYQIHGNVNVPSSYAENPPLAMWVKGQRRHYSLFQSGRRPSINKDKERTAKLDRLGFVWNAGMPPKEKKTVKPH